MIKSLQNITLAVAIICTISLVSSTIFNILKCPDKSSCLAATNFYQLNFDQEFKTKQSTPPIQNLNAEFSFDDITKTTQVVSTYGLAAAITIMIALEALELRYLKLFLNAKKRR